MLREMLFKIGRGGSSSINELAAELGVSPAMAQQAIDELDRMGFLNCSEDTTECLAYCGTCPFGSAPCSFRHPARMWTLTEKGERFLSRD
jgi:Mn-dependent DtxR family transcriptional regulator